MLAGLLGSCIMPLTDALKVSALEAPPARLCVALVESAAGS